MDEIGKQMAKKQRQERGKRMYKIMTQRHKQYQRPAHLLTLTTITALISAYQVKHVILDRSVQSEERLYKEKGGMNVGSRFGVEKIVTVINSAFAHHYYVNISFFLVYLF